MANCSAKLLSLFCLLILLSLQANARNSLFFSKVARETATAAADNRKSYYTTNTYDEETQFPTKEEPALVKSQEREPTFIPQTAQNGYGLYGHDKGIFPTYTITAATSEQPYTATDLPYKTHFEEPLNMADGVTNLQERQPTFIPKATQKSYGVYSHDTSLFTPSTTTTTAANELPYTTTNFPYKTQFQNPINEAYNTNLNNDNNNIYKHDKNSYDYSKQPQQQGMSDTRFLENGRYFYDINAEKNVPDYGHPSSRRNDYNDDNDDVSRYHGNSEKFNSYKNHNGMRWYQNQEEEEDFEFEP
ncbi:hypothetical protein Nepgr_017664 [Nepenthes gracilis]|uniref:Protein E6-like n=1 Tax=Nepenthes gracilis TaxID=150966 RepID=A0AAD3XSP4_NEPGR|nr:hypothetical protein Nepgr_017664 [Nepenthes gracilis]